MSHQYMWHENNTIQTCVGMNFMTLLNICAVRYEFYDFAKYLCCSAHFGNRGLNSLLWCKIRKFAIKYILSSLILSNFILSSLILSTTHSVNSDSVNSVFCQLWFCQLRILSTLILSTTHSVNYAFCQLWFCQLRILSSTHSVKSDSVNYAFCQVWFCQLRICQLCSVKSDSVKPWWSFFHRERRMDCSEESLCRE